MSNNPNGNSFNELDAGQLAELEAAARSLEPDDQIDLANGLNMAAPEGDYPPPTQAQWSLLPLVLRIKILTCVFFWTEVSRSKSLFRKMRGGV